MDRHMLLVFGTDLMRTRTLRIKNVSHNPDNTGVRAAMGGIIQSRAVATRQTGMLAYPRRAVLVTRNVDNIYMD